MQDLNYFSHWRSPRIKIYMRLFLYIYTLSQCQRLTSQWQRIVTDLYTKPTDKHQ